MTNLPSRLNHLQENFNNLNSNLAHESNLRAQSEEFLHQLINIHIPQYIQYQFNQFFQNIPQPNKNSSNEFDQPYAVLDDLEELKNNIQNELIEIRIELEKMTSQTKTSRMFS